FSSRRRHTRLSRDWSSDVCSSDLVDAPARKRASRRLRRARTPACARDRSRRPRDRLVARAGSGGRNGRTDRAASILGFGDRSGLVLCSALGCGRARERRGEVGAAMSGRTRIGRTMSNRATSNRAMLDRAVSGRRFTGIGRARVLALAAALVSCLTHASLASWSPEFAPPGVIGEVYCAIEFEGDLILAGKFSVAGRAAVQNLARWD